jgi:membrane associated rhomboid family serine protease
MSQSPFNELKMQFANAGALYRILLINIGLFLALMLCKTFIFLFKGDTYWLDTIGMQLSLPASPAQLLYQPWSLLTYMFLHLEFFHILFNMLILYWTGRLFTEYLGNDKFWATFILGGLSGALLFILSYNFFPVFTDVSDTRLMGASAGVIAILVGIATLIPNYIVHLLLFGAVRLKYIAIVAVLIYTIRIPDGNAGGELSHLGGALFGFVMVKQLQKGRDITRWLTNLFSRKGNRRKVPMEVVSRRMSSAGIKEEQYKASQIASQEAVDRILDKINKSGFDSLTKEEKETLYRASNKS